MKVDLITGLLGSGKTTFIKQYVRHLADQGCNVCILVNDYGAISVDMALLNDELGQICDLEMVTAGDWDCYLRRTKTKLIQMAMLGYDRIVVEPSGVFDADDFYDILREEPLDRWYEVGNVISLVDANLPEELSDSKGYLLIAQASTAGLLLVSKIQEYGPYREAGEEERPKVIEELKQNLVKRLNKASDKYHGSRVFQPQDILIAEWNHLTEQQVQRIDQSGMVQADMMKLHVEEDGDYETMFYYTVQQTKEEMDALQKELFENPKAYGNVIRVKGLFHDPKADRWYMLNATEKQTEWRELHTQKEVMLVVGENLHHEAVNAAFGETRNILDYEV